MGSCQSADVDETPSFAILSSVHVQEDSMDFSEIISISKTFSDHSFEASEFATKFFYPLPNTPVFLRYRHTFDQQNMDKHGLAELNQDMLCEMGVESPKHQMMILTRADEYLNEVHFLEHFFEPLPDTIVESNQFIFEKEMIDSKMLPWLSDSVLEKYGVDHPAHREILMARAKVIIEHRKEVDRLFEKLPSSFSELYKSRLYFGNVEIQELDSTGLSRLGVTHADTVTIMEALCPSTVDYLAHEKTLEIANVGGESVEKSNFKVGDTGGEYIQKSHNIYRNDPRSIISGDVLTKGDVESPSFEAIFNGDESSEEVQMSDTVKEESVEAKPTPKRAILAELTCENLEKFNLLIPRKNSDGDSVNRSEVGHKRSIDLSAGKMFGLRRAELSSMEERANSQRVNPESSSQGSHYPKMQKTPVIGLATGCSKNSPVGSNAGDRERANSNNSGGAVIPSTPKKEDSVQHSEATWAPNIVSGMIPPRSFQFQPENHPGEEEITQEEVVKPINVDANRLHADMVERKFSFTSVISIPESENNWGIKSDITYFSDNEESVPKPLHHFSLDSEKAGLMHLDHKGVPFPRIKNQTLFYGDKRKGWLETVLKTFRFPPGEWSVSLFFKVSDGISFETDHLPLLSQGELKETFTLWIQQKDGVPYVCVSVPCVRSNCFAKVPLESEKRKLHDWHHVFIKFRKRKMALILDSNEPIIKDIFTKDKRNKFRTHSKPLQLGKMRSNNSLKYH